MSHTVTAPIVVGAGISGLATALALARAGVHATVLEGRPGPGDRGDELFLNLASNGLEMLHRVGAADTVTAQGSHCSTHVLRNGRGRTLGRVINTGTRSGYCSLLLRRGDLTQALYQAVVHAGVEVVFDAKLTQVRDTGDSTTVTTASGAQYRGDLVLGCDGIHSVVRRHVEGAVIHPNYSGLICVGGRTSTPDMPDTDKELNLVYGRRAFFGYLTDSGVTYWFSNIPQPRQPPPRQVERTDAATWIARLRRLHANDIASIDQVLRGDHDAVVGYALQDLPPSGRWARGRVAIIGDAAHATTPHAGQGASMALEDAVALAHVLTHETTPEAAFESFDNLRRDRVARVLEFSRRMGSYKLHTHPVAAAIRDAVLPIALRRYASPADRAWIYESGLTHISFPQQMEAS